MIPVNLTIKGLYSYNEETTIDFTNLTEAGLFGIFGAVGSGKSTILEAISFALYGETERLNKSDKRSYNMMNLRSKQLLIDFIFTCGDCNDKYKFTVNAKRNSKNFSDGGKIERQAYVWKNNWIPTELNAEEILGLSYDNFKRTIIIPQGKFQEFLQLKETERVQMLKEIFSLEKFELSPKVSRLSKENELKVSHILGQMQGLPLYDEDLLKRKREDVELLDGNIKQQRLYLERLQTDEQLLQELKALFIDANAKTIVLNELQSKEKHIDELDRQIWEFERCEQVFKFPIENRNNLHKTIIAQEFTEKKLRAEKKVLETAIENETVKADRLRNEYACREFLLQKAAEFEKIVSIKSLQESIGHLDARIEKGQRTVEGEEKNLQNIKELLASSKSEIETTEQTLPNTTVLVTIIHWFNVRRQLETEAVKLDKEATEVGKKLSALAGEIKENCNQLSNQISLDSFPNSFTKFKEEFNNLNKEYDKQLGILKNEQDQLHLSQKLHEFAESLKEDAECPLCGSVHHPKVYSTESVAEELQQKQQAIEALEHKKAALHTALINLSVIYSNYDTHSQQHSNKLNELEIQNKKVEDFIRSFSFAGYCIQDEDLVKEQLAEIEEKNILIKNLRAQRDEKEKKAEEASGKIKTFKDAVDQLKNNKAQQEGQLHMLTTQLSLTNVAIEIGKPASELTNIALSFHRQHQQVTEDFERADKALHENKRQLATLTGRFDELQIQISSSRSQLNQLNEQIRALLVTEGFESEAQVNEVLSTKLSINEERKKVEAFRRKLHAANVQLQEITVKIEGKRYEEIIHAQLQETIQKLSKDLDGNIEKLVTGKFELQELNERMQARLKLQQDFDKLTVRAENLKILSNLFRSSGFVNYVSSVYLQNLVNSANQRFYKMTKQKLLLELAEDNAFRVRDFMNNGEVRSVKTLSGGQTFQAALSLALALADNIQHLTKSNQNFFFLDEGFGSLDKEALTTVFQTLKGLRKENRIVGVISHVEEMQQEIPVNLKITNDMERGSLVKESWN